MVKFKPGVNIPKKENEVKIINSKFKRCYDNVRAENYYQTLYLLL